jgi:hypothetical protein
MHRQGLRVDRGDARARPAGAALRAAPRARPPGRGGGVGHTAAALRDVDDGPSALNCGLVRAVGKPMPSTHDELSAPKDSATRKLTSYRLTSDRGPRGCWRARKPAGPSAFPLLSQIDSERRVGAQPTIVGAGLPARGPSCLRQSCFRGSTRVANSYRRGKVLNPHERLTEEAGA